MSDAPAYRRLPVDERRRRLLDLGADLFTQHAYDELSMAQIARAAGISKALLYHYFPSKEAYFRATLAQAAEELRTLTEPEPGRPPLAQLAAVLERYLSWIDAHETAYRKLLRSVGAVAEARDLVEGVRAATADRIIAGIPGAAAAPRARAAALGWLWLVDGATLEWLDARAFSRDELRDMLVGALGGALAAAGIELAS